MMTDGASFDDLIAAANSRDGEGFRAAISSLGTDQVTRLLLEIVKHQWALIEMTTSVSPAPGDSADAAVLTPAELLRFAAAGRREYARTAPPADRAALNAEADGYEEAAKLVEDPARLWAIVPTAMPAPAGKIDPRRSR